MWLPTWTIFILYVSSTDVEALFIYYSAELHFSKICIILGANVY